MVKFNFVRTPLLLRCTFFIVVILLGLSSNVKSVDSLRLRTHDNSKSSLELVAIIFRHGHRAPDKFYKSDPYKNAKKFWPLGLSQLTLKGKQQLFKLGQVFRKRYEKFVDVYSADSVRVNSSDMDRCHMSGGCLLASWFPPTHQQIWSKNLKWQPIPIHSTPEQEDRIIGLTAPCSKYDHEKDKVDKEIADKESSEDKQLYQKLSKHMKETVSNKAQIFKYYTAMLMEEMNGYKLPQWASKSILEAMRKKAATDLSSWSWNDYMKRITGGPMIKEISTQMTTKRDGKNKEAKLFLYSAHEDTIIGVWRALGFTELILPGFGGSLIFELHKNEGKGYFIKVLYMEDTTVKEPHELKIPHCKSPCLLDKFLSVTKYMREVDWDKDCSV